MSTTKLANFSKQIKVEFKSYELLKEALTHRSFINESAEKDNNHNERLEFLGDAVLELVTTEYLFEQYPGRPEGELTSFRAALVRTESLADTAAELGYGEYIFMSNGEEATGGRERPYILANTFEAVLGAIYLDSGYAHCVEFLQRVLLPKTAEIVEKRLDIDPKSKLQEVAQEELRYTPTYELIDSSGPDHDKTFIMAANVNGMEFGKGEGKSKQEAEQRAAQDTLDRWADLSKKYQEKVESAGT